jgi:putative phosphoserine phosphatase/1-acylglycerol-3-phosphate O-acyltransferase
MAEAAAFFDLDRTLLAGASGPVLTEAMRTAGLVPRSIPGERLLYGLFNTLGETLPGMALARQAATLARGRSRAAVQEAARTAADVLVAMVQPFAAPLFDEHRAGGRFLVLATTTPYDLVKPLADALGFDDVVATRYSVTEEGTYSGALDGNFVWAAGKLAAVRQWARDHDVDLADSWFYSDSVYDTPLLSAVGHPVVVNPDPRLVVMAVARRWPIVHLDVPPGVPKIPVLGVEPQALAVAIVRRSLFPIARFDVSGTEHIPDVGPAILCANHRSYFDPVAVGVALGAAGRTARFLGKKEVFDAPLIGAVARAMGGIRVDRGTGSDEPLKEAAVALEGGQIVAIMPQGTIPRGPDFFAPKLVGRWGAARLADLTRAPVVPLGLWGTEQVWPRSSRWPDATSVLHPPTIRIRVGSPVELQYRSLRRDTERIMEAIVELLPPEAREARTPSDEELARTYPPGYRRDEEQAEPATGG